MICREKVIFTLICGSILFFAITACAAPPAPTPTPTLAPTAAPTAVPTRAPTAIPTTVPTVAPTATATTASTATPTTAPTTAPTSTQTRAATATSTTAPTRTATTSASAATPATKPVNIAALLPAGAGRDLLFDSCSGCHSPLCPVIGQRAAGHWERVKLQHRSEVSSLSDASYKTLFDYLTVNFNDTKPEPAIPPEMKQTITCAPF
ncbi:MAG: hypothetical protein HZB51_04415 [Chloroflexi bacterium]|nr:hypothetical protein [Chloroflexota bacterium]